MEIKEARKLIEIKKEKIKKIPINKTVSHYTNFQTLNDYILKNKTLKMTRLDLLNDLEEKKLSTNPLINEYNYSNTFITCFENSNLESIPMWFIYARDKEKTFLDGAQLGVCLQFNSEQLIREFKENPILIYKNKKFIDSSKSNFILFRFYSAVLYDDNLKNDDIRHLLNKNNGEANDGINSTDPSIIDTFIRGAYKSKAWNYENEFRLRVISDCNVIMPNNMNTCLNHKDIFFKLSQDLLSSIKIVINPFIPNEEFEKMKNEILNTHEFINKSQIIKSELTTKIRV